MAGRPELAAALEDLDRGNELVIAEWDRATRSMWDGLQIIKAARLPTALRSASWFCILRRRRSSTARMQTGSATSRTSVLVWHLMGSRARPGLVEIAVGRRIGHM